MTKQIRMVVEDAIKNVGYFDKLLREHWEESAKNKDLMVLKPDYKRYAALSLTGNLLNITVYDGDEIVGYSVNIIGTHLHYSDLVVCNNDVLFLKEEYRKGLTGIRLLDKTEEVAKEGGAKLMLWHAKKGSPLDIILSRRTYPVQDIIYSKQL